jgi:3-phosphoshikimate 1-carboxyvinyltransferase
MFATEFLDLPAAAPALRAPCVTLPGSKSISNRVLLLAALCQGTTGCTICSTPTTPASCWARCAPLGCGVTQWTGSTVTIDGLGGRLPQAHRRKLFLGNAGTAMRPLTAALAVLGGDFELSGVPRMHERPIGDLVDALRQLGCQIDYTGTRRLPASAHRHCPAGSWTQPIRACAAMCPASSSPPC